jgi:hypothetical protein
VIGLPRLRGSTPAQQGGGSSVVKGALHGRTPPSAAAVAAASTPSLREEDRGVIGLPRLRGSTRVSARGREFVDKGRHDILLQSCPCRAAVRTAFFTG